MRDIANNVRSDNSIAILHLFELDMHNFDNSFKETLRFTDHDIFVFDGNEEYTPLSISFNTLTEDFSMQASSVSLSVDNINGDLANEALLSEWRNNRCEITRVVYKPASETLQEDVYEFGVSDNSSSPYPRLELPTLDKDVYTLFKGVIDSFSATAQAVQASIGTQFTHWAKPYPTRTYSQNEFTSIVDAINDTVYWGRQKD